MLSQLLYMYWTHDILLTFAYERHVYTRHSNFSFTRSSWQTVVMMIYAICTRNLNGCIHARLLIRPFNIVVFVQQFFRMLVMYITPLHSMHIIIYCLHASKVHVYYRLLYCTCCNDPGMRAYVWGWRGGRSHAPVKHQNYQSGSVHVRIMSCEWCIELWNKMDSKFMIYLNYYCSGFIDYGVAVTSYDGLLSQIYNQLLPTIVQPKQFPE